MGYEFSGLEIFVVFFKLRFGFYSEGGGFKIEFFYGVIFVFEGKFVRFFSDNGVLVSCFWFFDIYVGLSIYFIES